MNNIIINASNNFDRNVVLVGEVLIDIIKNEIDNSYKEVIGGSPYNICKNLTQLGIDNKLYSAIGDDIYGDRIQRDIENKNLNVVLNIVENKTSFVEINQTSYSPTPIFFRGSDNHILLTDKLLEDVSDSNILHFTFWPLSKEPSRSMILALVKKAKNNQTLIGLDPNYHPLLDDNKQFGLTLIKEIIQYVDIIKPSLDDSFRLFGKKSIDEYLDIYESLGAKIIILTLGKDGLIVRHNHETKKMPSLATKAIDSTGAGDAFWSGLYAGLIKDLSLYESIELGLMCSAESLKKVGSNFSLAKIRKSLVNKE